MFFCRMPQYLENLNSHPQGTYASIFETLSFSFWLASRFPFSFTNWTLISYMCKLFIYDARIPLRGAFTPVGNAGSRASLFALSHDS